MYQKILVPLDGSKRAEKILTHVEKLAAGRQTTVVLMQVIAPAANILTVGVVTPTSGQLEKDKKHVESYLNSIKERLKAKLIEARTRAVVDSLVVEAILQAAEEEKADLIAISSHGRSGVSRIFYGSVAVGLLHRVDRPLLIIRSRKADQS
jgi:nucleotide-binding universal stress UspA family protein